MLLEFLVFLLKLGDLNLHPLLCGAHFALSAVYLVLELGDQLFLAVYLVSNLRERLVLGLGRCFLMRSFHAGHDTDNWRTPLMLEKGLGH